MLRKLLNILLILTILPFNSSFIYMAAGESEQGCDRLSSGATTNANCAQLPIIFENNSFEDLSVQMAGQGYIITDEENVPGWNTTSTDKKIEVWTKDFYNKTVGSSGNYGITGEQFVEINATQNAALYQDFATEPGQTLKIYLNHGGRSNGDSMNVVVGTPQDNSSPTNPTVGGSSDILVTDTVNKGQWNDVAVEYIVPEGQTTTRIAFVSAGSNHYSGGNFIDNVHVGIDSVYDNSIEILAQEERVSYADSFTIVNQLSYESGAYLGKFKLVIDTGNFTNLRNPRIYNKHGVEMSLDNVTYEDDIITIIGGYFEEGYVTFEADSTLEGPGTLSIDSTLNYLSLMDVALVEAGLKDTEGYYWVKNSAELEVVSKAPEFTGTDATIDEGSNYTESELIELLNVSVFDIEDDRLGVDVTYTNGPVNVDQAIPGTYPIEFSATDSHGKRTTTEFTITVADVAPVISLENQSIEMKVGSDLSAYPDQKLLSLFGAEATEINPGDLSEQIQISHNINPSVTGEYDIAFDVTDNDGTKAMTQQAKVFVVRQIGEDIAGITPEANTAPTINVESLEQTILEEQKLSDEELLQLFGVIATDTIDDTLKVEVDQSTVNYSKPGMYQVTFTVTDLGNLSKSITTSLIIDDVLPQITYKTTEEEIHLNENPTDAEIIKLYGAEATEITAGDLSDKIKVSTNLMQNVTGKYAVVLSVTDEEGNATSSTFNLEVTRNHIDDIEIIYPGRNAAPKITAESSVVLVEEHKLSHKNLIELYNVKVSDDLDAVEDLIIKVDDSAVNYSKPGTYNITFTVVDSGNLMSSKTVELEIGDIKPRIQVKQDYAEVYLNADVSSESLIKLFGAKATEFSVGDLTEYISVSDVQSNVTGKYQVNFLVADEEGNIAIQTVTLKVIRNLDVDGIGVLPELNTAPTITANKMMSTPEETTLTKSQLINLFEVEVADASDRSDILEIAVEDTWIDYSTPGIYPVTFTVTDSGKLSTTVNVELEVTDLKPTIDVVHNEIEVYLNADVTSSKLIELFGVQASEQTPGDLTNAIVTNEIKSNVTGIYPVKFSVSDEEGNSVTKIVKLTVIRNLDNGDNGLLPGLNTAPEISAKPVASTTEESLVTRNQLIDLFDVQASDCQDQEKLTLNIDYSQINISKPGIYPVVFSATDSGKLTTSVTTYLEVTDVLPTVTLSVEEINVKESANLTAPELINKFGVVATEINSGDLKQQIEIDGDYKNLTSGLHSVKFAVIDEEGNIAYNIGTINVGDKPTVEPTTRPLDNEKQPVVEAVIPITPVGSVRPSIIPQTVNPSFAPQLEQLAANTTLKKATEEPKAEFEWVANEDGLKTIAPTQMDTQMFDNTEVLKQYARDLTFLTAIIIIMISITLGYKVHNDKRS